MEARGSLGTGQGPVSLVLVPSCARKRLPRRGRCAGPGRRQSRRGLGLSPAPHPAAARSSRLLQSSWVSPSPQGNKEHLGGALLRHCPERGTPSSHVMGSQGSIRGRERCLERPVCLVMDRCSRPSVAQRTGPGGCGRGERPSPHSSRPGSHAPPEPVLGAGLGQGTPRGQPTMPRGPWEAQALCYSGGWAWGHRQQGHCRAPAFTQHGAPAPHSARSQLGLSRSCGIGSFRGKHHRGRDFPSELPA